MSFGKLNLLLGLNYQVLPSLSHLLPQPYLFTTYSTPKLVSDSVVIQKQHCFIFLIVLCIQIIQYIKTITENLTKF